MVDEGKGAKPLVLITEASGNLGQSLARAMADDFRVIGLDQTAKSFLFTRLTMGASGAMAVADHLLGALVLTLLAVAAAEVCRAARLALVPIGLAMVGAPFLLGGDGPHMAASILGGLVIAALAIPRGRITESYGTLDRIIR